jgi:hypothetical protein
MLQKVNHNICKFLHKFSSGRREPPRGCSFTPHSEFSLRSAKWTVQTCAYRWFSLSLWKTWLNPASCFAKNQKILRLNFLRGKIKKKHTHTHNSLSREKVWKYTANGRVHPMEATNAYEGNGIDSIATFIINLNTRFAPRFYSRENPSMKPQNTRLGGLHKQSGNFSYDENQTTVPWSSSQ